MITDNNGMSEKNRKLLDEAVEQHDLAGIALPLVKRMIKSHIGDNVSDDELTEMAIRMVTKPMINMHTIPQSVENVTNADEFIENVDNNSKKLMDELDKNNLQPLWDTVNGLYFVDKDEYLKKIIEK